MDDIELIEKHFRKELTPEETAKLNERLAGDSEFKRRFETESLLHKALQFSRERERIKAYALKHAPVAVAPALSLNNSTLLSVGATALAVWIFSTFSSSLTSLSPEYIKWVGLTAAIAISIVTLALKHNRFSLRLGAIGLFNGILVFVMASGIDAINQGAGAADKNTTEAYLIPFTGNKPWWPTQSLEDSLDANRKQMMELRNQMKAMVSSRLSSGPNLNFGAAFMNYAAIVVPRSSTVTSGATYEAEVYLATSPLQQKIEMRVDGRLIPMVADRSGVIKGKVSFTASANQFDNSGKAKKTFDADIRVGDSTYTNVVEYYVIRR